MKIRFTTSVAGPKCSYKPGDPVEIPDNEAKRHIENGNAVAHDGAQPINTDLRQKALAVISPEEFTACAGDGAKIDALIESKAAELERKAAAAAVAPPPKRK